MYLQEFLKCKIATQNIYDYVGKLQEWKDIIRYRDYRNTHCSLNVCLK